MEPFLKKTLKRLKPFYKTMLKRSFIFLYTNEDKIVDSYNILFLAVLILGFSAKTQAPIEVIIAVIIINYALLNPFKYVINNILNHWNPRTINNVEDVKF